MKTQLPNKPELISFKICPFVQRSVITLLEKKLDYTMTYIDLADPPTWFNEISPLGKVPVLRVDNTTLFESAVINEYLDQISPPSIHPSDPLLRAKNRAWIEFSSDMIMNHYHMQAANDEQTFTRYRNQLAKQFKQVEQTLGEGSYFNGNKLSLVDTAFAPLFMRIDLLEPSYPLHLYPTDSRVSLWGQALASLDSVKNSVSTDFNDVYSRFVQSLNSHYSDLVSPTASL